MATFHNISELDNTATGATAFIVGNGASKTQFDIDALKHYGLIFACNKAWRSHHADFLGFRDDTNPEIGHSFEDCLQFPGTKFTNIEHMKRQYKHLLPEAPGDIYFYDFYDDQIMSFAPRRGTELLWRGSTAYVNLQIAYRMGCKKIILVGCDACRAFENEPANVYYDDTKYQGMANRWNQFKSQFDACLSHCQGGDARIYKLGKIVSYGAVEAPVITIRELEKKDGNND